MSLTPEAEKWVAALRSGKYNKGSFCLHKQDPGEPDEYCCLGVACEVAIDSGLDLQNEAVVLKGALKRKVTYYGDERTSTLLPERVAKWLGLGLNISGSYLREGVGGYVTLPHLNDAQDLSFEEIADSIEAHWGEMVEDGKKEY